MFEFHKITQSRKVQAYHRQPKLAASEFPNFILILCLLEKVLCPSHERILDFNRLQECKSSRKFFYSFVSDREGTDDYT